MFRDGGNRLLDGIDRDAFREGVVQRRSDDAAQLAQEKVAYDENRRRQYHSELARALRDGEYDRAQYTAYGYGDDKAGTGIGSVRKEAHTRAGEGNTAYANVAAGIARLPYEARRGALAASKPRLMAMGISEADIDSFDPTDENLAGLAGVDYSLKDRESQRSTDFNNETGRMDSETKRMELDSGVVVDGALVDRRTGDVMYRGPKVEHTPYGSNQYLTPGVEPIPGTGGGDMPAGAFAPQAGPVTSGYGQRRAPTAGASTNHQGIDIGLPRGAPVQATEEGVVVSAGPKGGYGNQVRIRHANGVETTYSHMDNINVRPGDRVGRGQPLGGVGSTGTATGPHLHYEVYQNGQAVNPAGFGQRRPQTRQTGVQTTPGFAKPTAGKPAGPGKAIPVTLMKEAEGDIAVYKGFDAALRTFKPGYGSNPLGRVENLAQRMLGDRVGTPGQQDWWAGHFGNDNVERHKVFGAALTGTEKAAWEATTISPGMRDELIERNLRRRRDVVADRIRRKRRVMIAQGYSREAIDALFGGL